MSAFAKQHPFRGMSSEGEAEHAPLVAKTTPDIEDVEEGSEDSDDLPEITADDLPADTLAALRDHVAARGANQVSYVCHDKPHDHRKQVRLPDFIRIS